MTVYTIDINLSVFLKLSCSLIYKDYRNLKLQIKRSNTKISYLFIIKILFLNILLKNCKAYPHITRILTQWTVLIADVFVFFFPFTSASPSLRPAFFEGGILVQAVAVRDGRHLSRPTHIYVLCVSIDQRIMADWDLSFHGWAASFTVSRMPDQ